MLKIYLFEIQVFTHFLHPRTPFMIRIFMANCSNETSSAFNDTTIFDKCWKIKGFVDQGMGNKMISEMLTDSTLLDRNKDGSAESISRVSMLLQVIQQKMCIIGCFQLLQLLCSYS